LIRLLAGRAQNMFKRLFVHDPRLRRCSKVVPNAIAQGLFQLISV